MKGLWDKLKAWPFWAKALLGIVMFLVCVGIYDAFTGQVRDLKNWMFDRQQAKIEQQNAELLAENDKLRLENAGLRNEAKLNADAAIKVKAQEIVLDAREKEIDSKTEAQLAVIDKALAEQTKVEEQTGQPVDDFTRCERTKQKMLANHIPSASKMNCEEFKHE